MKHSVVQTWNTRLEADSICWCSNNFWVPPFEVPPVQRPEDEKIHRLLVIDGFTGHTTLDFIGYCIKFNIIVAVFPSHSTHILQPLNVSVSQFRLFLILDHRLLPAHLPSFKMSLSL